MTLTLIDGMIAAVLLVWLIASLVAQRPPKWFGAVARRDYLLLLPRWNFFAPLPGDADPRLYYRDRLRTGEFTRWQECAVTEPRPRLACLWNPAAHARKALFDIHAHLTLLARSQPETICLSTPYLLLLNCVDAAPRPELASHREFAIVEMRPAWGLGVRGWGLGEDDGVGGGNATSVRQPLIPNPQPPRRPPRPVRVGFRSDLHALSGREGR